MVSEELPEEVALSRNVSKAKNEAMQRSEGRAFGQREQHVRCSYCKGSTWWFEKQQGGHCGQSGVSERGLGEEVG